MAAFCQLDDTPANQRCRNEKRLSLVNGELPFSTYISNALKKNWIFIQLTLILDGIERPFLYVK